MRLEDRISDHKWGEDMSDDDYAFSDLEESGGCLDQVRGRLRIFAQLQLTSSCRPVLVARDLAKSANRCGRLRTLVPRSSAVLV